MFLVPTIEPCISNYTPISSFISMNCATPAPGGDCIVLHVICIGMYRFTSVLVLKYAICDDENHNASIPIRSISFPMSDAEPLKPSKLSESKDTGYTPGNDLSTRWRNTLNLLLGRLTDEGLDQYRKDRDDRYEKQDCARCEKYRDNMLNYSENYATFFNTYEINFAVIPRPYNPFHARENQPARGQPTQRQYPL